MQGSGSAAGGRWARPTLTRPIVAMTHNINGYTTEEIWDSKKTVRYEHLFGAAKRADVTLIGLQEHHARTWGSYDTMMSQSLTKRWGQAAVPSGGNPGAALFWRQDRWESVGSFSITQRAVGALLRDKEGETWLTISVHFPSERELQQQPWDRLVAVHRSFETFPFLLLSDHNSILLPMEDDLNVWKGGPPVVESQAIKEARTAEARVMSRLGLLDTWRHIYDDVDDEVAVGATRGHRRIHRI